MKTTHKSRLIAAWIAPLLLCGCGILDAQDSAFDTDDGFDESTDTDEPPPAPTEGFRVFPRFMLQSIPAIVTIEASDGSGPALACELDGAPEGGYVCDAGLLAGIYATIRVDKDGFEGTVRNPEILTNQIHELDVHLSVEGGPTGVWSACVAPGEFDSCAALCEGQMTSCAVTSCATEQVEWPIATLETFTSLECVDPLEALVEAPASSCDELLPVNPDVLSLRCCCAG